MVFSADSQLSLVPGAPAGRRRILRRPKHTWNLRHKPWTIQPFCIAPVLPGETLKQALYQSRCVTDPLENPLIGWFLEYHWFYVRHRDIDSNEGLQSMVLDPGADVSSFLMTADNLKYYENYDAIDAQDYGKWVTLCMTAVVEAYFRDEGELVGDHTIDGVPSCQHGQSSWLDSYQNDADYLASPQDFSVDLDADTTIEASEVARSLALWRVLSQRGLVSMSYEEYLAQYGVKQAEMVVNIPEHLRSTREWVYPSNTIDPTSGVPTSACSWSVKERIDKDRYFKEPGFVFGVTVGRPKIYFSKQTSHASSLMIDAYSWMPPTALNDPAIRMRKVAAGEGPLQGNTDAYWFDVGDLLRHGDQFRNYADTEDELGMVDLPAADGNHKYVTEAMADLLFVDNATPKEYLRQDGVVRLDIATHVRDVTPTAPNA